MSSRPIALAVTTAALLLAACTANDPVEPVVATSDVAATTADAEPSVQSATPTPTPTPSSTEMSIDDAATQFLDIADLYREAAEPVWDDWDAAAVPGDEDWQRLSDVASRLVPEMRAYSEALVAAEWPEEIQDYVDALVSETVAMTQWYDRMADTESEGDFLHVLNDDSIPQFGVAVEELGLRLGLVSVGE